MNMYLARVCVRYEKCKSAAGKTKTCWGYDGISCFYFNRSTNILRVLPIFLKTVWLLYNTHIARLWPTAVGPVIGMAIAVAFTVIFVAVVAVVVVVITRNNQTAAKWSANRVPIQPAAKTKNNIKWQWQLAATCSLAFMTSASIFLGLIESCFKSLAV